MVSSPSIRSVCVYCGSSPGNDPEFENQARKLGELIAGNGWRVVYGGGDWGLMGAVAEAALSKGGAVLGVIPEFFLEYEPNRKAKNIEGAVMEIVPDMHTRKARMFEESDAFIALPGGIGTLEEVVEMLTWSQLGRHTKPVGLLNIANFWSPYVQLMDHMAQSGFLHNPERIAPVVCTDAEAMMQSLSALFDEAPGIESQG